MTSAGSLGPSGEAASDGKCARGDASVSLRFRLCGGGVSVLQSCCNESIGIVSATRENCKTAAG